MAKDIRESLSTKNVLIHIVDSIANLEASSFTTYPLINFFNKYYGGGLDKFVDLGFDETNDDTDLTPSTRYGVRLDHQATDFTLTPAKVNASKKSYLGTKDAAGTPNDVQSIDEPDVVVVSVTLSGMPSDLEKLYMSNSATSPTGWQRYNGGTRPATFGVIVAVIDNKSAPTTADNITIIHFLNKVTVVDAGQITASAGGDFERTITFQCTASNHIAEVVAAQNTNALVNV